MAFIFGGGTGLSYEDMLRRRELANEYIGGIGNPQNVGEGLSALGKGLAGGLLARSANKAEVAGKAAAQEKAQSVMGQLFGQHLGFPQGQTPPFRQPTPGEQGAAPPSPGQAVASDTLAALGKPTPYVQYSNQGATRNKPISGGLTNAMSFLPDLGVTMEVFSGGQDGIGEGDRRTGSTRHDHGQAADAIFYKDGRRLDWANPDDQPLFREIVQRGKAAGVTGFGAGDGYMQPGSMHLGFGAPGVWGAGGKGENAAGWLRAAYDGGEAPVVEASGGQPKEAWNGEQFPQDQVRSPGTAYQPGGLDPAILMQLNGAGLDPAAIMEVISDPYLDEGTRSVLGGLFQQHIDRRNKLSDPAYLTEMQRQQLELQKSRLELEQMQNPQSPAVMQERQALAAAAGLQPGSPEYQSFMLNGKTAGSDIPSAFQSMDMQAQAAGLQPGTPEYQSFMLSNGSAGAPAAFVALDMQAQAAGFVPGTPEYQQFMATRGAGLIAESKAVGEAKGNAQIGLPAATAQAEQSLALIDSIRNDPALPSITGSIQGGLLPAGIPGLTGGQAGADLGVKIEQLQGTAFLQAFESLKGGGAITEIEGQKAEAAIARLRRAQSTEAYQAALDELAGVIRLGLARSQAKAGVTAAPTAPQAGALTAAPQRLKFNPQTGAFE